jgi:hypothetical protein
LKGLAEHVPLIHFHGELAPIGPSEGSLHPDPVADIRESGEMEKPIRLVRVNRLQESLLDEELNGATLIGQGEKSQFAHYAPGEEPPCQRDLLRALLPIGKIGMGLLQLRCPVARGIAEGIGEVAMGLKGSGLLQAGRAQIRQGGRGFRR